MGGDESHQFLQPRWELVVIEHILFHLLFVLHEIVLNKVMMIEILWHVCNLDEHVNESLMYSARLFVFVFQLL